MSCNLVLITNGSRPRLLEQTLRTLKGSTPEDQYTLTIIGEGSNLSHLLTIEAVETLAGVNASLLRLVPACNIIGRLKNLGCYWSEKQFGRGEWLCFIDDDVAFRPGCLKRMQMVMESSNQLRILGGVRHPYHGVTPVLDQLHFGWQSTDAVAGYCHFMRWSTWDKFGPYDAHAKGTGQSEDYAICRKVVDAGGKVGYIHPPVMAHCGITDSNGKTILGADLIERAEGVLYL